MRVDVGEVKFSTNFSSGEIVTISNMKDDIHMRDRGDAKGDTKGDCSGDVRGIADRSFHGSKFWAISSSEGDDLLMPPSSPCSVVCTSRWRSSSPEECSRQTSSRGIKRLEKRRN